MKKTFNIIYLMLFSSILLFSCKDNTQSDIDSSSPIENESTPIVENPSIPSVNDSSSSILPDTSIDASTPSYITLNTPKLTLNEQTGVVTFEKIENASYYRYYINSSEYKTTTNTTIALNSGESISVMADNDDEYILESNWSDPVSYYKEEKQDIDMITIFFHNTSYSSVEITNGSTYTPSTPSKDGYTFDNWYLDPFYSEQYDASKPLTKDTILYANFIEDTILKDTTFWVKANDHITSANQKYIEGSSWKFIPLSLESNTTPKMFSATVQVSNATTTSFGEFIVLDGFDDNAGRTYWKNKDDNFTIKSNGTYKISFSLEKEWLNGTNYVHASVSQLSSTYNGRRPLHSNDTLPLLQTPVVTIDKQNNLASWTIQDDATYAYQIDNQEVQYTNDNNVTLNENSFIVVKAISTLANKADSKWSLPYLYLIEYEEDSIYYYVYFHDCNIPSIKVKDGECVNKPNNPSKAKYTFDNWYTNISKTTLFDFNTPINKNTVIYSKWTPLQDYKTTTFYTLETSSGTKLADFTLYEDNLTYNEFYTSFTVNSSQTLYVKRLSDGVKFGPYVIDESGTYDMYFSEEHLWDVNTEKERNAYWSTQSIDLYFSNALYWSNVYYYTWDDNGDYKTAWPGEKMSYVKTNSYGQDIYKVSIPKDTYSYIIFNNGSGSQTVNIDISNAKDNDAFYSKDEKENGKHTYGTYTYS